MTTNTKSGAKHTAVLLSVLTVLALLLAARAGGAPADATLSTIPGGAAAFCNEPLQVVVQLDQVSDLFGYQIELTYDPALVEAEGKFDNSFFNTVGAFVLSQGCSAGTCLFAVSLFGDVPSLSGSGPLATVTLTSRESGTFDLAYTDTTLLTDRDGIAVPVSWAEPALALTVCGTASISGVVDLQGRPNGRVDAGQVTLVSLQGEVPDIVVPFDPQTGTFTIVDVPVHSGSSKYRVEAAHALYLSNAIESVTVAVGQEVTLAGTGLRGGDANNDAAIDILDMACIGAAYGGLGTCDGRGSSDINADDTTDLQDLALAGGNYTLAGLQVWQPLFYP